MKNWSELCNQSENLSSKGGFMNIQEHMEESLWNYIDGRTGPEEKSAIDALIESNLEWKKKYHELLEVNQLLTSSELEGPSMRFTKNVMEEIAKFHVAPATRSYINKKIIWGIGGFFVATMIGFIVYAFSQVNWSSAGTSSGISSQVAQYTDKFDWSKLLSDTYTNIFIGINVVLGLVLLDMYLQRKKELRNAKV
jgi:hypothetical protein